MEPFKYTCPGPVLKDFAVVEALQNRNKNTNLSICYIDLFTRMETLVKVVEITKLDIYNQFKDIVKIISDSFITTPSGGFIYKLVNQTDKPSHQQAFQDAFIGAGKEENLERSYLETLYYISSRVSWCMTSTPDNAKEVLTEFVTILLSGLYAARDPESDLYKRSMLTFDLIEQQKKFPIPVEGSEIADDLIREILKERDYPANPMNAARAGWRAARLYMEKKICDSIAPSATKAHNTEN